LGLPVHKLLEVGYHFKGHLSSLRFNDAVSNIDTRVLTVELDEICVGDRNLNGSETTLIYETCVAGHGTKIPELEIPGMV